MDLVVGPDAYRDLPRLLSLTNSRQTAINVLLSQDETYADIAPVRADGINAFVSIMRGCNNMCSYCIVPFTRGRERSRDLESIVAEVEAVAKQGVREVTLLGQNVNSYNYRDESIAEDTKVPLSNPGFSTIYRTPVKGYTFADLLQRVSDAVPEVRIRFTSPHPKDFPPEVLGLIRDRPNICNSLHIPAQSGSSSVLERMRRGYTREAYLDLVKDIKATIPGVTLSSDFISGFCGETEEDHSQTLSLLETVGYDQAYMFHYSQRERTHAHRQLADDVPLEVKKRRLVEVIETYHRRLASRNDQLVNTLQVVLIEGDNPRAPDQFFGRSDGNKKVYFPKQALPSTESQSTAAMPAVGEFVVVRVTKNGGLTLRAEPLLRTTLAQAEGALAYASRS